MKIRLLFVLKEVSEDLEDGKKFYDEREPGIGDYFFNCILSDIESLKIYGGIHPRYYGFYRMLSNRFPFAIYYSLVKDIVIVAAVLDMRREPAWIHQKLITRTY
ncbi:MAG: type II toxin-antitoxin system RelE/ParE family toxin [Candidatus Auribacterota bacterium]|nr:type II toxin-antitoxin system RelE/ParE family toxin [Candidatus Auribacterota bacterium]